MQRRLRWVLALSWSIWLVPRDAGAICREVTETGSWPPAITPDQEILVIKRSGVPVGCEVPVPAADAGGPGDAGPPPAGDGGAPPPAGDAGAPRDGGAADAGAPADGAAPADAGSCQPRTGDTITWVVQPRFSVGPDGSRFALLMVTPRVPVVEVAPASTFEDLARATAPLVTVEERYGEDASLGYQCEDPKYGGGGCGYSTTSGGTGAWVPPDPSGDGAADAGNLDDYIPVQTVGSYQVVVLDATDADELDAWLTGADYAHGREDIDALRPYLELGWTVVAVRVSTQASFRAGGLEPLSFTFEGTDLRLPLGVARQPAGGQALLKIYVAAEGRYEVPGAALSFAGWTPDADRTFLTASTLEADLSLPADQDPVLARAAADAPFQDEFTKVREIRIPSSQCPRGGDDDGGDGACDCGVGATGSTQLGSALMAIACAAVVLRRRRRPRG